MRYRKYFARRWVAPLFLLVTLAVIALSACGTRGNPPALGKPVQVTLSASGNATTLGQATLTPAYGAHVVVYMHGALVPYDSSQTPAQLREGGCYGKVVAPLTSNAPTGGSAVVAPGGSDKGANVALPVDANWYVVVLKSAAPNAAVTACGHPLNNMRQYFDLYEPDKVDRASAWASPSTRASSSPRCMSRWPRRRRSNPPSGASIVAGVRAARSPAARLPAGTRPAAA